VPAPTEPGGKWEFVIPDWLPPSLNDGMGRHWAVAHAIKKTVAEFLSTYARLNNVPPVTLQYRPVRRFEFNCVGWGNGETMPDPDNLLKFTLDAATHANLLVDDAAEWCKTKLPFCQRGSPKTTFVFIEDLEIRPPINPDEDPRVKRWLGMMKGRANRDKTRKDTRRGKA
jgi:hypothetical protein